MTAIAIGVSVLSSAWRSAGAGVAVLFLLLSYPAIAWRAAQLRHRARYGWTCRLCGQSNRLGHDCPHLPIDAARRRLRSRYGRGYYERFYGRMKSGNRTVWTCSHHHGSAPAAVRCAQARRDELTTGMHLRAIANVKKRSSRSTPTMRGRRPSGLSDMAWLAMRQSRDWRCEYCNKRSLSLEKEHWVPLSRGGADSIENIVPSCAACNRTKGTLTGDEYLELRRRNSGK